jgi:hypothetical protein
MIKAGAFREKLTYANVVATLALFAALGGASYASFKLPKNSVGPKQLAKNAVTKLKVRKNSITGPKIARGAITAAKVKSGSLTGKQIRSSTLGNVPTATAAKTANVADSLAANELWHLVGTEGEPQFQNLWHNFGGFETVAFFKDHEGIVHLRGALIDGNGIAFQLPAGYRPGDGKTLRLPMACSGLNCPSGAGKVEIFGPGVVQGGDGGVKLPVETQPSLDGITFRAES